MRAYRDMRTDCKIDPVCEWSGPYRLLVEHQKQAHGILRRQTVAHQNQVIMNRKNKGSEHGACFEDNWRLMVMLDALPDEHWRHYLFDHRNVNLSSQKLKWYFEQALLQLRNRDGA